VSVSLQKEKTNGQTIERKFKLFKQFKFLMFMPQMVSKKRNMEGYVNFSYSLFPNVTSLTNERYATFFGGFLVCLFFNFFLYG
jgi:hypothetical protein